MASQISLNPFEGKYPFIRGMGAQFIVWGVLTWPFLVWPYLHRIALREAEIAEFHEFCSRTHSELCGRVHYEFHQMLNVGTVMLHLLVGVAAYIGARMLYRYLRQFNGNARAALSLVSGLLVLSNLAGHLALYSHLYR